MSAATRDFEAPEEGEWPTLELGAIHWIKNNIEFLQHLPGPGEEWQVRHTEIPAEKTVRMQQDWIIKHVGYEVDCERSDRRHYLYQTNPHAFDKILDYIEERARNGTSGPCPLHSGIRNLGDGKISCTNDDCDRVFNRRGEEL